jgi:SHOCT-like domain
VSENRREILEMLSEGKITPAEADRLLTALDDRATAVATVAGPAPASGSPRYLRVLVDAVDSDDGPVKVNVRVPLRLLRAGVKLASLIPPSAQGEVNGALREYGVPFDLSQIRPENLDELIDNLTDLTVDIDQAQENVKVRIFCE